MSPLVITLSVICLVVTPISFFFNTCIIMETGKSFINGVKTNQVDLIHLAIGISNILMQCILTTDDICYYFPKLYNSKGYIVVILPLMFTIRFSYWLMAWLCACYCTNITRFNHRIFIFIKKTISSFLPHLLFLSGIGSLGLAFVNIRRVMLEISDPTESTFNTTQIQEEDAFIYPKILCITLEYFFPFLIIVTSLMVTVSSLLTHIRNMNKAGSDIKQNIQIHINAARTMMLLLLLSIVFYISTIIDILVTYNPENIESNICWIMVSIFPAAEGAILIHGSPKLRNMFLTWLSAGGLLGCCSEIAK
uniref:Taste receptor type 2 n=1 Tax=Pyxicephalus adspersus TaxID=30357 RepID=A0AAV3A620_PYXAD|nr:TPA: hypothetical protein GDO54_014821 [Pyxicephalus adspersus]